MNIPLVMGKNSSGEDYTDDLESLPHLFVSYHEENRLTAMFLRFTNDISENNQNIRLYLSLGRKLAKKVLPYIDPGKLKVAFTHSGAADAAVNNIDEFIASILIKLKERSKRNPKKLRNRRSPAPVIVLIDDIFEVIRSAKKKTAITFIELLVKGPEQSIYFIAGSAGIYKNLLNQVIHINPALRKRLQNPRHHLSIDDPLAAELIINPDGLIFFRQRNQGDFTRLFPDQV